MNLKYSKENVLLDAAYNILTGDMVNTGSEVREIFFYTAGRIFRDDYQDSELFPQITLRFESAGSIIGLPTQIGFLVVTPFVRFKDDYPNRKLADISQRIITLFDDQDESLNLANAGKNLRCRLIRLVSAPKSSDALLEMFFQPCRFQVRLDDEILTCT